MRKIAITILFLFIVSGSLFCQTPAPATGGMQAGDIAQFNAILSQLQQTAQASAAQIRTMRIDKWKTDANSKQQSQANADSLIRNLSGALPELITKARSAPQDLSANFRLYRNLNALYDVIASFTESAGAFGPKDQYESLAQQVTNLDTVRRQVADRLDQLVTAKDMEIAQLRNQVRLHQAQAQAAPPKKIIVDDTEPAKSKKKKAKPAATPPSTPQ